jgi:hypothetical protein
MAEQKVWRESLSEPKPIAEMLAYVADFKGYRDIEYFPGVGIPKTLCRRFQSVAACGAPGKRKVGWQP